VPHKFPKTKLLVPAGLFKMNIFKSYFHPKGHDAQESTPSSLIVSDADKLERAIGTPGLSTTGSELTSDGYPAEMKKEVLVRFLYQEQCHSGFNNGGPDEGVVLKVSKGQFTSFPEELQGARGGLFEFATQLNSPVCAPITCVLQY
jgi:hypothetical protein